MYTNCLLSGEKNSFQLTFGTKLQSMCMYARAFEVCVRAWWIYFKSLEWWRWSIPLVVAGANEYSVKNCVCLARSTCSDYFFLVTWFAYHSIFHELFWYVIACTFRAALVISITTLSWDSHPKSLVIQNITKAIKRLIEVQRNSVYHGNTVLPHLP